MEQENQETREQVFKKEMDTVTDQPQGFDVTVLKKNILHKIGIFKKTRTFYIYPANLATLAQISKIYQDIGVDENTIKRVQNGELGYNYLMELAVNHTEAMIKVIAHAIKNTDKEPPKQLKKFLSYNLTPSEMVQIIGIVNEKMDLANFIIGITLGKGVNLKQEPKE